MAELDTPHARLADLRRRWLMDPESRLFLQLAEEYRRLNRHEEAIEVLEQGLKRRPNDLSGMVALGRCRLESGELDEAVDTLEAVAQRDPAHIVANKLLLEAYLQQGKADKARGRLDLYKLLNDRDPELNHLEYRLRQLAGQDRKAQTAADPEELALEDFLDRGDAQAAAGEARAFDSEGPTMILPKEKVEATVSATDQADGAQAAAEANGDLRPEPFPGLPAPSAEEHLRNLSAEGIFELRGGEEPEATAEKVEAESPPLAAVPVTSEIQLEQVEEPEVSTSEFAVGDDEAAPSESAEAGAAVSEAESPDAGAEEPYEPGEETAIGLLGSLGALAAGAAAAGAVAATTGEEEGQEDSPAEEPAAPAPEAAAETAAVEEGPRPEAASEPAPAEPAVEAPEPVSLPPSATPATAELELGALSPTTTREEPVEAPTVVTRLADLGEAEVEAEEEPGTTPTATLAQLYLEQGHEDEAEKIYRQVLALDPDNAAAREGLRELGGAKPLSVRSLLPETGAPQGVTARKILLLQNYLERIRREEAGDVR